MLKKLMAGMLAVMLALGLAPAPALASLVAAQGTKAAPTELSFDRALTGQLASAGADQWYRFTTPKGRSCYDVRIWCANTGDTALVELYDDAGNTVGTFESPLVVHRLYLLKPNSSYRLKVASVKQVSFSVEVKRTDAPITVPARGANSIDPYRLTFGKPVRSQFDAMSPNTSNASHWFCFKTDKTHSTYTLKLLDTTDDQQLTCTVLDRKGNEVAAFSTYDLQSHPMLLKRNTTYTVRVSANYANKAAYPSYQLTAYKTLSKPKHPARGTKKSAPFALTLGKPVSSQFDEPSDGVHDQWFTFTTSSKVRPYLIEATSETAKRALTWSLYERSGFRVASSSTTSSASTTCELAKNTAYTLKVTSNYSAATGYPSYRLRVSQVKPGAVPGFKVSAGTGSITVRHGVAESATFYQIAYRKAGAKKWSVISTAATQRKISRLVGGASYHVKIRSALHFNGTDYYGSWSKAKKVTVR